MFKQLSAILDQLIELHRELLTVAEKKRKVVISGQPDALQNLLKEEDALIAKLETVEEERLKCVGQIAPAAKDVRHVTLHQLLEQMDERDRTAIQGQMKQLLQLIEQLKRENELNQTLVHESLQHVQHTLNVLTKHPAEDYLYGPRQQEPAENRESSGIFDRKA